MRVRISKRLSRIFLPGLLTLSLLLPASPAWSEMVFLRNGKTVEGRVVRQTPGKIELMTAGGSKLLFKKDIKRIQYVPVTREERLARARKARELAAARRAQREALLREKLAKKEKERAMRELEEKIRQEKLRIAKLRADRAAALRSLVEEKKMEKPADEPISYKDFAWRSLVLPGWGHFHIGRPVVGSIYAGTTGLLLLNTYEKRRIALAAKDANHNQVLLNVILTTKPELAPFNVRLVMGYEANRKAFTDYQRKVDSYNYSLYLLEVLYGAQLLHIIYNGIAWENGLFIVRREVPVEGEFRLLGGVGPDRNAVRGGGTAATLGMVYHF